MKRGLGDSTDHGNATPPSPTYSATGSENRAARSVSPVGKPVSGGTLGTFGAGAHDGNLAPHHALARFDKGNGYLSAFAAKSSPLKRSDGIMNLDQASLGSPSAKRRSLHGTTFSPDFDIFDYEAAMAAQAESTNSIDGFRFESQHVLEHTTAFAPMPKRTSSLRKTTLQQRYEKPTFARSRPNPDLALEYAPPGQGNLKGRHRMSLENVLPPLARDSPFSSQGTLPSASIHPMSHQRKEQQIGGVHSQAQRHPLSRTLTQSSSSSSMAEDSPTHVPIRLPEHKRPTVDFSKSLPVGAIRSLARDPKSREIAEQNSSSNNSFATPENYKLAKPLPAAFMSTGLISKRNKRMDHPETELHGSTAHMPDTPCKRPNSLAAIVPAPAPDSANAKGRHARRSLHSFGTPSTPFNPHAARVVPGSFGKGVSIFGSSFTSGAITRRGSFVSIDGEESSQSPSGRGYSQSSTDLEFPPTPTKQAVGFDGTQLPSGAVEEMSMVSPRAIADTIEASNATGIQSSASAECCKLSPKGTPCGSVDGDSDSVMGDSPSPALRFRSFTSITSFSTRSRLLQKSQSPTPLSKKCHSVPFLLRTRNMKTKPSPLSPASPLNGRSVHISPRTPQEAILPPDPSGLSISAHGSGLTFQSLNEVTSSASVPPPATPTGPKDHDALFGTSRSSITPVHGFAPSDVDPCLTSRFDKVEIIGTGEFSQVYRVAKISDSNCVQGYFSLPTARTSPKTPLPDHVWAVKKSRNAYIGARDRQRKLQEVEVLRALGQSDHTVQLYGSWEFRDHLYIQTEFCEEGSLDLFLEQVGRNARLDDFRIWKVMLELCLVSLGLEKFLNFLTDGLIGSQACP